MRVRDYGLGIGLELGTTVGLGLEIVGPFPDPATLV